MNGNWIGYLVSVKCSGNGGVYQGTITHASPDSLTLTKAFWNGFPHPKPFVSIKGTDIIDLSIIGEKENSAPASTIECKKEQPKPVQRTGRCAVSDQIKLNTCISPPQFIRKKNQIKNKQAVSACGAAGPSRSQPIDIHNIRNKVFATGSCNSIPNGRRDKHRKKNEDCFGSSSDDPGVLKEFDFEKNLALFDKNAVLEEIKLKKPDLLEELTQQSRSGYVRSLSNQKGNYRHDENVLANVISAELDSLIVPSHLSGDVTYITDEGLRVQSVSRGLRSRMWELLSDCGLTEASTLLLARSVADLALRLLGGARRLDPLNNHQKPTVLVLVGPHRTGCVAIQAARLLLSHGCGASVLTLRGASIIASMNAFQTNLKQFRMAGGVQIAETDYRAMNNGVDLIVMGMVAGEVVPGEIVHSRAQKILLDPPEHGVDSTEANISVAAGLPLAYRPNCGKIHLANISVPQGVFEQLDLEYRSPFGAKTIIPLHPGDL